jgi:hypothetical protein
MEPTNPKPRTDAAAPHDLGSVADELHREAERLQRLAAELKAREEALAEMQANYPYFKRAVYGWLRERFESELPPIPEDMDLETWAKEEGALPLEAFIEELERLEEGR